jgi:hypothetical protein
MTEQSSPHYLSLFGDLTFYYPDEAGELVRRRIEGVTCQALLAAMAVARRPRTRAQLFQEIWRRPTTEIAPIYTTTDLLKKQLEPYDSVIVAPRRDLALTDDATTLQTDWALFEDLMRDERYAEALAIARRGMPLDGIEDDDDHVGEFVKRLRERALKSVLAACTSLDLATDFQWGDHVPDDWPRLLPLGWPKLPTAEPVGRVGDAPSDVTHPARPRALPSDGIWSTGALFEPCSEGEVLRTEELAGSSAGSATWWPEGNSQWFGEYYAFWHRTLTTPCEEIGIEYIADRYDSSYYGVAPEHDGDNDKAIIVGAKLLGDNPKKRLICAKTTWNFAHEWAKGHADDLLKMPSQPSVFGLIDRKAYPGIAGVHTLLQTSDGFLLFGLRAMQVDFHEGTWSASFEESIAVRGREFTGPVRGDATVLDAINGGLVEEWGIDPSAISTSSFLAVGREYVRTKAGRLDLSSSVIAAARLTLTLSEVWGCLADAPGIRDRDEHAAWAGIRFPSRSHLLGFLAAGRRRRENVDLLVDLTDAVGAEIEFFPGGASSGLTDFGLMPTSAARLYLGSDWLTRYGWMEA